MKRPRPHQIDEEAQRIFRNALPSSWVVNEHTNDYGKDFHVETADASDKLTGLACFVQLKGQDKVAVNRRTGHASFSLRPKHAEYYLDKVTDVPVFLVLVDVKTKEAWWLFLQPCLRQDQSWRKKKKKHPIKLPLSNRLSDVKAFETEIGRACRSIKQMNPLAIEDAIEGKRDYVRALDNRFDTRIDVINGQTNCRLLAKSEVPLKFSFQAKSQDDLNQKIKNLFGRGAKVQFDAGEITVTGSPLFEDLVRNGVILQCEKRHPATICISTTDENGNELGRLDLIPGELTGGTEELWFRGGIKYSPFSVEIGPMSHGVQCSLNFKMSFGIWNAKRISELQWFDRIAALLSTLDKAATINIEYLKDGNHVTTTHVPLSGTGANFVFLAEYVQSIQNARRVCKHYSIDPEWILKDYDDATIECVNQLHDVLFLGKYSRAYPGLALSATVRPLKGFKDFESPNGKPTEVKLEGECTYEVFGHKIKTRMTQIMTNMLIIPGGRDKDGDLKTTFKGNEDTVLNVEAMKEEAA